MTKKSQVSDEQKTARENFEKSTRQESGSNPAAERVDVEDNSGARIEAGSGGKKIAVCSKISNGLCLRVYDWFEENEATQAGYRTVKVPRQIGEAVYLNRTAMPWGVFPEFPIPAGYSITMVDEDFWKLWTEQNKDSDLLKSRVLFSASTQDRGADRAREQAREGVRTGREPLNPKELPRVGLGLKITTADATDKAA